MILIILCFDLTHSRCDFVSGFFTCVSRFNNKKHSAYRQVASRTFLYYLCNLFFLCASICSIFFKMSVSASGAIRSALGPIRKRASDAIAKSCPSFVEDSSKGPAFNLDQLSQTRIKVKHDLEVVTHLVLLLQSKDEAWTSLIGSLDATERAGEQTKYDEHVSSSSGHMALILQGQTKMAELKAYLDELEVTQQRLSLSQLTIGAPTARTGGPATAAPQLSQVMTVKLPKFDLPTFNGDPLQWTAFWNTFSTTVANQNISDGNKLSYLLACLSGTAKAAVAALLPTDANYAVAKEILTSRFGKDRVVKNALFSALTNMRQSGNSAGNLRSFLDAVERTLQQLEHMGENVEQTILLQTLMQKLPQDILLEMSKLRPDGEDWSVKSFRLTLKKTVETKEEIADLHSTSGKLQPTPQHYQTAESRNNNTNKGRKEPQTTMETPPSSASAMIVGIKDGQVPPKKGKFGKNRCLFCGKHPYSYTCKTYGSAAERKSCIISKNPDICLRCIKPGHKADRCNSTVECYYCKKNGVQCNDHVSEFCYKRFPDKKSKFAQGTNAAAALSSNKDGDFKANENKQQSDATTVVNTYTDVKVHQNHAAPTHEVQSNPAPQHTALLLTASTKLINMQESTQCIETAQIFFDTGAQKSFISSSMAKKLQLPILEEIDLAVHTFGSSTPKEIKAQSVQVAVLLRDRTTLPITVLALPHLTTEQTRAPIPQTDQEYIEKTIPLSFFADKVPFKEHKFKPDLIIGMDLYFDFLTGVAPEKLPSGLYTVPSKLGLLLGGAQRVERSSSSALNNSILVSTLMSQSLEELSLYQSADPVLEQVPNIQDFWQLESIGVLDSPDIKDDDVAVEQFNNTVSLKNGRYWVQFPKNPTLSDLPDNKSLSLARFKSLDQKLQQDKSLLDRYTAIIQDQLKQGIIEPVFQDNVDTRKHYLAHHPVLTPLKATTKLRIVYDGSAKCKRGAPSLNDALYRGQVILKDLCALLLNARIKPIVVIADIEKAFLQLGLQEDDRDLVRFFYYKDMENPSMDNLQVYRFCRVPFGLICSPFLLGATVRHHLRSSDSDAAKAIEDSIYVDNVIMGVNSVDEALQLYHDGKTIFKEASMNLREWGSNSTDFLQALPKEDQIQGTLNKLLGVTWDCKTDVLCMKGPKITPGTTNLTKRAVLKAIASVFDPLGLIAPITIPGRIFLQDLWKQGIDWDTEIPEEMKGQWSLICNELQKLEDISIERYLGYTPKGPTELHIFVDASQRAYGAAAYLRWTHENTHQTKLLFAKVRLSPKKPIITVPRLELLGILIGSRLMKFLHHELQISIQSSYIWTDSVCCLHWLQSTKNLSRFVENRRKEILQIQRELGSLEFRHVGTNDNPADLLTRGSTVEELQANNQWWLGPKWLSEDLAWPVTCLPPISEETQAQLEEEIANKSKPVMLSVVQTDVTVTNFLEIDINKFSTLEKLLRTTVYSLRAFKNLCWNKISKDTKLRLEPLKKLLELLQSSGAIIASERKIARIYWNLSVQQTHFEEALQSLKTDEPLKNKLVKQLGLKLDNFGLIRCHGRLINTPASKQNKFPVLLPRDDLYTKLIIQNAHGKMLHSGVQSTLSAVRQEFWIPKGRATVRQTLQRCGICKKAQGGPFPYPPLAPLPQDRVQNSRPFDCCGLDYLGPVLVKTSEGSEKTWIALFTCLATRSVHLEVALDLSALEFLSCLRRFIARRGTPSKIISDNASQFGLAKDALSKAWRQMTTEEDVITYCASKEIQWTQITPLAPWQGGVYERLVGLTKSAFKKAVGRKLLTTSQLLTLTTEIEAVLNSRPITYIYEGMDEKVLRPIDFLIPNGEIGSPDFDDDPDDPEYLPRLDSSDKLLKQWRTNQIQLDKFWDLWKEEYVQSLRERTDVNLRQPRVVARQVPKKGDVVLVHEENLPRGSWKVGRIHELNPSRDDLIRSAKIQLPNKSMLTRPVNKLYPIEVSCVILPTQHTTKIEAEAKASKPKLPRASTWNNPPPVGTPGAEDYKGYKNVPIRRVKDSDFVYHHCAIGVWKVPIGLVTTISLLLILIAGVGTNPTHQYQICGSGRHGHPIEVPKHVKCELPPAMPIRNIQILMWIQREVPQRTVAYRCYIQTHQIITRTSFLGGKGILADLNQYSNVSPEKCWDIVKTKIWNTTPLVELTTDFWSTNKTLDVTYHWCCYDHVNAVTNLFLEVGEVASLNGKQIISDLHDMSACTPSSGYCQDPNHGTTVWNGKIFQNECAYELKGRFSAKISGFAILIPKVQGAFSYDGNGFPPESECVPKDAFYTDQGAVFLQFLNHSAPKEWLKKAGREHLTAKTIADLDHEDHESYRRLYMYQRILEIERHQFGLLWQQLCAVRQTQLQMIWQWLRIHPTLGLRVLLNRTDIHGEWAGDAMIFWECQNISVEEIHWSGKVLDTCYQYVPVTYQGKLWFVIPGTRDLTDHSPTTDCQHAVSHFHKDKDGIWRSSHGRVQVTQIPVEMAWKGLWSPFTFSAPSIFMHSDKTAGFHDAVTQYRRLLHLESVVHRLVNYTADLSLDPAVIHNMISGVGTGIGKVIEGTGRALGHTITGLATGVGSFLSSLITAPFQLVLNIVITAAIILLILVILFKFRHQIFKLFTTTWRKIASTFPNNLGTSREPPIETVKDEEINTFIQAQQTEGTDKQSLASFEQIELKPIQDYQMKLTSV